jgi:hypothetical protein
MFSKNITTGMFVSYFCNYLRRICTKLPVSFGHMYEIRMTWTVITSFSSIKPRFDPRAHVGSAVNTAVLKPCSYLRSIQRYSSHVHICGQYNGTQDMFISAVNTAVLKTCSYLRSIQQYSRRVHICSQYSGTQDMFILPYFDQSPSLHQRPHFCMA